MADSYFTPEELASEEWRPIAGTEGRYEVSSLGRVRRSAPARNSFAGRVLRPQIGKSGGYRIVPVRFGSPPVPLTVAVHRLVALAFLGPCPEGAEVDHVSGDKGNNRATNLEYVTHGENTRRAFRLSLRIPSRGRLNGRAIVTEESVREIRERYAAGETQISLARRFGIAQPTVSQIILRQRWAHVT